MRNSFHQLTILIAAAMPFLYSVGANAQTQSTEADATQTAPAAEPAQSETAKPSAEQERIQSLITDLDSDDFRTRESATAALIEAGEAALAPLTKLQADPPSPEVEVRLVRILRELKLAELRRNAVHIHKLLEQTNKDKRDTDAIMSQLENLVEVLSVTTGRKDLKLPVKMEDVKAEADRAHQKALIVGRGVRQTSIDSCIVLADVSAEITSARNSIILARAAVRITSAHNCIVIAGYDLQASSIEDSILFSGDRLQLSIGKNCILGAGGALTPSILRGSAIVNSDVDERRLARRPGDMLAILSTDGLVLRQEEAENPLAGKIVVTHAVGDVVLFRKAGGDGEYVARLNQPIKQPDGDAIDDLEGWQACYSSHNRAIFTDDKRFVALNVVSP